MHAGRAALHDDRAERGHARLRDSEQVVRRGAEVCDVAEYTDSELHASCEGDDGMLARESSKVNEKK